MIPISPLARLYGPQFAADPGAVYEQLRAYGPVVPVELAPGEAAMLVIGYWAARDLLQNTAGAWSKDSSIWASLRPDSPLLGMLGPRPNPLFADGERHAHYRRVVTDCLARIRPHELRAMVHGYASGLIGEFAQTGWADLVGQYARRLPLLVFNRLFGMPDASASVLVRALAGMMEADGEQAIAAAATFEAYLGQLLAAKQRRRGDDLTSWILDHPAGLTAEEVLHHIILLVGAGNEPTTNLISNAISRMLSDDRYYSTLAGGALTTRHAIEDVLRNEPPMANYGAHYLRSDAVFHGVPIPAHIPVLVSYAAANTDPAGLDRDPLVNGGAHLAWSAGAHACPAQSPGLIIATTAIDGLMATLPNLELATGRDQLQWRPGPFHRALVSLPVRFTPITRTSEGDHAWHSSPHPDPSSFSTPQDVTSPVRQPDSATWAPSSR